MTGLRRRTDTVHCIFLDFVGSYSRLTIYSGPRLLATLCGDARTRFFPLEVVAVIIVGDLVVVVLVILKQLATPSICFPHSFLKVFRCLFEFISGVVLIVFIVV